MSENQQVAGATVNRSVNTDELTTESGMIPDEELTSSRQNIQQHGYWDDAALVQREWGSTVHTNPVQELLRRLDKVKATGRDQWQARCPAHDDHNPSLSIGRGLDGRALVTCHAGCDTVDVLAAVGLSEVDLFTDESSQPIHYMHGSLRARKGLQHTAPNPVIVATYDYTDSSGKELFQVVRYEPKDFRQRRPDGNGGWTWSTRGAPRVLYRLPEILNADPGAWVFVVEGEKDVDNLTELGLTATTSPGGAGRWSNLSDYSVLSGRRVVIIPDCDDPGRCHAHDVAAHLQSIVADVRIVNLGEVESFKGKDVSDWLEWLDSRESEDLACALLDMAEAASVWTDEEWQELIPLRADVGEPQRFPVEVFPSWLRDKVKGVAVATQTPLELAGSLSLGVMAMTGAGKVQVELMPDWNEPLNLYLMAALPPGCRKSAVFRAMTAPLVKWERTERTRLAPEIEKAKTEREILEKRLTILKKKAAGGDQPAEQEALNLSVKLSKKVLPVSPRLFTGDVTPEGVSRLLAEQDGRLGIFSAEGGEFTAIAAGRYSRNGRSNMEVFLKGHAGDAIRVDRANGDCAPIILDYPALTVFLCVQPSVLKEAWQHTEFGDRGLLARFLYILPPNPLGTRDIEPPCVAEDVTRAYEKAILRLLKLPRKQEDGGAPVRLTLTDEAWVLLKGFMQKLEPELGPEGRYGHMTAWAGKLAGAVARIAGVLHLANDPSAPEPWRNQIDADTMSAALVLGKFYSDQVERVRGAFGGTPETQMAWRALEWIKRIHLKEFSVRDLYRKLDVPKAEALETLKFMEETNHVRPVAVADNDLEGRPGRKPSPMWEVNPALWSDSVETVNSVTGVQP